MQACFNCHAGCCRNFTISLTGYDILNIAKTLNIEPVSFIQIIEVNTEERIKHHSQYTALFKFSDYGDSFYLFALRMFESKLVPETAKCLFLQEWFLNINQPTIDTIIARCGIYNSRPLLCSTFPTKLNDNEQQALILNLTEKNISPEHEIYNLCSEKFKQQDINTSSDQIVQNLVLRKYELNYFKSIAEYWNQTPGTLNEFLSFMVKAYSNRAIVQ